MNRLVLVLMLAGVLLVGLTGVAVANWGGGGAGAQAGHGKMGGGLRGVLVSVSPGSIVVKSHKAGDVTVAVDANTKVKAGRRAATLADLKAGERVGVFPATGTAKVILAMTRGGWRHHGWHHGGSRNSSATRAGAAH